MKREKTYLVRFGNAEAVRQFRRARKLVAEASRDAPWSDTLKRARRSLTAAWKGLTFRQPE